MAEALTVVGIAVNKLSAFLIDEGKLLGGLEQEIQLIHDEFGHMKAFLEKAAESNRQDDPQLTEWISQVREVSYTTRDILDEFNLYFAPPGPNGSIQKTFRSVQNLPVRRQLASKLRGLKARIEHISEARRRYESQHHTNVVPQIHPWRHSRDDDALLVEEADLVGIDEQRGNLISRLLDAADSQLKVMAVVGMGGIGKTTLVRKVYDDFDVKYHFHIRAWVTVSQTCDARGLLTGLIQQVVSQFNEPIPPQMASMDVFQLKALVKDFLGRGRYVIVFDDVWDTDFWDAFRFVLPENEHSGNHVMLTTRIAGVALASTLECQGYVHRMGCLSFENSWILFCKKIFKGKQCPDHLVEVAKSIVANSEGLPLAILAIGGLMASKDLSRVNEWELVQSRLRDEFQKTGRLGRVGAILSLSYNDLPSRLQTCLLYTSIYPRLSTMPCHHLIQLLVAEGFVEEKEGQTAEEIAVDYLNELANRSLIQLSEVLYNGYYRFFYIHDLWREFLACKSREQNLMNMISTEQQIGEVLHPRVVVRRLVLDHSFLDISSLESHNHCHVNNLRSIIIFGVKPSPSKTVLAKLLSSKLLTVLDFRSVELECIPKEIFKLFHLKYLALCGKKITKLSKSIQKLTKLEYLSLTHTNVWKLPMEIHSLHKLRYLTQFRECLTYPPVVLGFRAPRGMKELVELQEIDAIDVADSDGTILSEIGKLAKLRVLWVTNVRTKDGIELCSSIEKLNNLQRLYIYSSSSLDLDHSVSALSLQSLCKLGLFGRLEKFPSWVKNVQGLKWLQLSYSNLSEDPLENMQHLPHLSELYLTEVYQGESLCFRAGCFLKLEKMLLGTMKALKYLRIEEGAMPALSELTLEHNPLLENLPLGIEHLRQLQRLNLWDVNSGLIDKLENEESEDDRNKIAHIPRVSIGFLIDGQLKTHWLSRKKNIEVDYGFPHRMQLPRDGVHDVPETGRGLDIGFGYGFGTLLVALLFLVVLFISRCPLS